MIVGVGIDLCDIERMGEMIERHGPRFIDRCFTEGEQVECGDGLPMAKRYAARFAAKEAVMKAFGLGWTNGMRFIDIEVKHNDLGKPELIFHNYAAQYAAKLQVVNAQLSLTHEKNMAAAFVVLESAEPYPDKLQQSDATAPGES
ncbi:MAG: holo-ACP synthase [Armatimonadota bacterium]